VIALVLIGLALVVWGMWGGAPVIVAFIGVFVIGAGVAMRDG
jgi:hypothetical protein